MINVMIHSAPGARGGGGVVVVVVVCVCCFLFLIKRAPWDHKCKGSYMYCTCCTYIFCK